MCRLSLVIFVFSYVGVCIESHENIAAPPAVAHSEANRIIIIKLLCYAFVSILVFLNSVK